MTPTDPPTANTEADSGNRDFLQIAMGTILVGCVAGALLVVGLAPEQYRRLVGLALAALAAASTLWALRRGNDERAYQILTYGLWCGLTVSATINGGMAAPSILAYPVLILIAGWVMGTRTVLILTGLSVAAELAFVVGGSGQLLPEPPPAPPFLTFLVHALILTVSASLALFVRRSFAARFAEIARRDADLSAQYVLYGTLLDAQASAGVGLFIIEDGRIVFSNNAFRRLVGYSGDELAALPSFVTLTHPDDRERVMRNHQRRLAGEAFENRYDIGVLRKDGERREAEITVTRLPQEDRVSLLVIIVDITARRRAEAWLREIVEGTSRVTGAEFFRALVKHLARALDVPFALVGEVRPGEDGRLHTLAFWVGDRFAGETDYDLATTPCGQVFGKQACLFASGLAARFPQASCTIEALGADSYYGYPLTDAAGVPLGVLAIMDRRPLAASEERASLMSIFAARAAAELERQRAEAGGRASEQKFERIVRASPVPISISRLADGLYLDVNPAYVQQFGWKRDEMIGRTTLDIGLWSDPDRRRAWVEALRRNGRVENFEALMRSRDGEDHIILLSAEMFDLGGDECALAFLHDVTEHKRAERWIRELNADLEERVRLRTVELTEANRELESFAYSISHDLRAPLRGIDGFSRLLQEEYGERLDQQGTDYLVRVRRAAQRLGTLIDDLLDLSRVTRHEMQRVKVDLSALATDIVDNLRRAEPERAVTVEIKRRCVSYGDPRLLRVLLENLIDNAWKYSRRTEDARIEFDTEAAGKETVYRVRDNGVGFDMAYADKLFVPFQRLHNPAEFQGSGVGLASAARVVRRHGGKIWAESAPGQGAVFRFTLGNQ